MMLLLRPIITLFPYTTLFRSEDYPHPLDWFDVLLNGNRITNTDNNNYAWYSNKKTNAEIEGLKKSDRKSTRLNSSHMSISYAVFCLKKKSILHSSCVYILHTS